MTINDPLSRLNSPAMLIQELERQQHLADELASLAGEQSTLIETGGHDELLNLVSRRQALINALMRAQGLYDEQRHSWNVSLQHATSDEKERVRALLNVVGRKLTQVMKTDERDRERLRARMNTVRDELSTLNRSRDVRSTYNRPSNTGTTRLSDGARFTDQTG